MIPSFRSRPVLLTLSALALAAVPSRAQSIVPEPTSTVAITFCNSDPAVLACPCGNQGEFGHGCGNSLFPAGAQMLYGGDASLSADTLALGAGSVTGPVVLFYQGSIAGSAVILDDGIGCVSGSIVRLGLRPTASNEAHYPGAGDLPISVRGGVTTPGTTTYYQCVYRNSVASFCTPATSNRTNAFGFTWRP
jgi:hypothetical protein